MVNPLLDAALAYARQGFAVFPCRELSKEPANVHGHLEATTDPIRITAWWTTNPNYNIGIVPGSNGKLVVDVDVKNGAPGLETLTALEAEHGAFPPTLTVATPSGGRHFWFNSSLRQGKHPRDSRDGIDIKAALGYVLAPPSVTDAGSYTWAARAPVADLPAWFHRLVDRPTEASRRAPVQVELDTDFAVACARDWLKAQATPIENEGSDHTTYQLAARLGDMGISDDKATELLAEKCPDFDEWWIAGKVSNAFGYRQNEVGSDVPRPAEDVFADALPTYRRLIQHRPGPVKELIEGLLERNRMAFLIGGDSLHKSRIAAQWGLSVHVGQPVWGHTVERAHFIHLSWENGLDEDARRAHKILERLRIDPKAAESATYLDMLNEREPLLHIGEAGIAPTELWNKVEAICRNISGQKFMVIDSAYNAMWFHGQTKVDEGLVRATVNWWDSQCQCLDMTGLTLQHPSRSARSVGGTAGYSQAWDAAPRVRLTIEAKDLANHYVLTVAKRNNAVQGGTIDLVWSDGIIDAKGPMVLPEQAQKTALEAVLVVALEKAELGCPFKSGSRYPMAAHDIGEVQRRCGIALTKTGILDALNQLLLLGRLVYQANDKGGRGPVAGYYGPVAVPSTDSGQP